MDADLAIWISECLLEVDGVMTDWRAIKKYGDDYEVDHQMSRMSRNKKED